MHYFQMAERMPLQDDRNPEIVENGEYRVKGSVRNQNRGAKTRLERTTLVERIVFPVGLYFLLVLVLIDCSSLGICYAQETQTIEKTTAVCTTSETGLYDLIANGTDLRLVLEALARRSGLNIVLSPDLKGEVRAHLKDMTVDSILEYLSSAHGFKYEKSGNTYLVASKENLSDSNKAEIQQTSNEVLVWECRHMNPADLVAAVKNLFPNVKVTEGPNAISPELDVLTGAVQATTGGTTGASVRSTDRRTATKIVLVGSATDIHSAKDVLQRLDVPRAQVEIQVAITEINSSMTNQLGIEWSWTDLIFKETADTGIGFGKFNKEGITITAVLSALLKEGAGNLLAQPKVSVLDCETAEILIGERILYPKLVGYNQVGAPIYDKGEERVGIYLQIAPKVAGDGEIILTLYPQVSLVTGFLKTVAGDYPQISTREARTTVSVKSGETLAIGGLLRDNEIITGSKVPFLGDLPIIGHLFKNRKKAKERTEIVILLSPRIVNASSEG